MPAKPAKDVKKKPPVKKKPAKGSIKDTTNKIKDRKKLLESI